MIAPTSSLSVLELCAGAGGQSIGLERAGFDLEAAVELDPKACLTLTSNRPGWKVVNRSIVGLDPSQFRGVDVVAGGVPCPPFSVAGKQLGPDDERDLFPAALDIIEAIRPKAVFLENVRGFADDKFAEYRAQIFRRLEKCGLRPDGRLLNACNYGVPQLRPRFLIVALRPAAASRFRWPMPLRSRPRTVGETLGELMASRGWKGATSWAAAANDIAPTLVGGSKKHGGPDLGPTRARAAWARLRVDGLGVADEAPSHDAPVEHIPRLTVRMAALIQGFPADWRFKGGKTAEYRQVGNAFPPPVACAVAGEVWRALQGAGGRARSAPAEAQASR